MPSYDYDIIIIGGGLVGAAAALVFARAGKRVAVLEKRAPVLDSARLSDGWDARIYAISPANEALLRSLDAWPGAERIQPVSAMDVRGDNGGRITFDSGSLNAPHLTCMVENRWLLAALWQAFAPNSIEVIHTAAHSVATQIDHACLTLADGTQLTCRLLVGADGAHSWLRERSGIRVRSDAYGHSGVVANFETEKPHQGVAYQWFEDGQVLAYLPLPGQRISIVWSTPNPTELTALALPDLAAAVAARGHYTLGTLNALAPAAAFELVLRRPDFTAAERMLLIGDAAHTIHPLAGQGVNLGFGDVIALRERLADAADPGAWPLLQTFAQSRIVPVRQMQLTCDALFHLFAQKHLPGIGWLRNRGLSMVNAAAPLKKILIRQAMGLA